MKFNLYEEQKQGQGRGASSSSAAQTRVKKRVLKSAYKAIKYEAQDFNTEIKGQNARIEKLGNDIDAAEENMVDANSKMENLLAASNHCYLWVIISIELTIMILFFFVF